MRKFLIVVLSSFFIFFGSWFIVDTLGINTLRVQSEQTVPAMFLPLAIIYDKTLYLDSYYDMMISRYPQPDDKNQVLNLTPFYLRKVGEHYVSAFTIITPLMSLPIYLAFPLFHLPITWDSIIIVSHISSALIMSLSGYFMYVLLKKHLLKDEGKSVLLTFIYLFCTINYALISQALWQHGTVQLFSILGLIYVFNFLGSKHFKNLFFSGLFLGLAFLSRPTAGLSLALAPLIILFEYRKNLKVLFKSGIAYSLGVLANVAFFFWYNATYYVSISNQGYSDQLLGSWLSPFPQGFLGVWLSPSKGILVYSPVFLFIFVSIYLLVKKKVEVKLYYWVFLLILMFHTLTISLWKHWYGGWSFGYRMSSDVILYMVLMLIPFVLSPLFIKLKKYFYVAAVISFLMQLFGIVFFDGIWHAAYDKGFVHTDWLWSIKDSEIMFNLRRVLVKLHLLDRACPKCQSFEITP